MSEPTPLVTENDTEWLAVAHIRQYPHLPHGCPVCWLSAEAMNVGIQVGRSMATHPSGKQRSATERERGDKE